MNIFLQMKNHKWFSNIKLQQKLLISYLLLIIVPMLIFMYFSYNKVSKTTESLLRYSAQQSFEQSGAFVSKKIEYAIKASAVLCSNDQVVSTLSQDPKTTILYNQNEDFIDLNKLIIFYTNFNDIYKIKFYINDDFIYAGNDTFKSLKSAYEENWYNKLKDSNNEKWFTDIVNNGSQEKEEPTISYLSFIKNESDYLKNVSILRIDIKESDIKNIVKKAASTRNSISFVLRSDNVVLSSSSEKPRKDWILDYSAFQKKINNDGTYFGTYNIGKTKVLMGCSNISDSGLIFVTIIPYEEILSTAINIRNQLFVLMIVLSAIAYCAAYLVSISIVKRLKILIINMQKIQNGEFGSVIETKSNDEIGELMHHFNYMSDKLSFLVKEQFIIGQKAKSYELKALQGQINPHFLYNTLDLINWTAIDNDVPQISSLVQSLSKFYKLSLSKGLDIIPIKDELEHVRLYMEIQNFRFDNVFNFISNVNDDINEYSTIKLILQPIIENSITHGIMRKQSKTGTISITTILEDGKIIFTVSDDGAGMTKNELDNILSLPTRDSNGYGIRNINERIKLYYGEEYGLTYKSSLNVGTTVKVVIPALKQL